MAEMEKEGRPPENKRSRKPAHPVKREINEEMKVRLCAPSLLSLLSDAKREEKGKRGSGGEEGSLLQTPPPRYHGLPSPHGRRCYK